LGINADFVYQGWNSLDALRLTPDQVFMVQGTTRTAISQFKIEKNWVATFSGRLGGSYDLGQWVTVHLGALYETSAVKNEYFTVDFPHPSRFFFTGGVTGHLAMFDVLAGFGYTPTQVVTVQQSEIRRGQTDPTIVAGSVGSGLYTVGGWVATVGVRGHFLEHTK
jgi:long-subunit fatty acid transport protein